MIPAASLVLLASQAGTPAIGGGEGKAPSVRVASSLDGRIFTWRVTNVSAPPITRFKVPVYSVYNHEMPPGWEHDKALKSVFDVRAVGRGSAIRRGQTRVFSARATSSGAVLGGGTALIGFDQGDPLEIDGVWVPKKEGFLTLLIPPLVIAGVAGLHFMLHRRRDSRSRSVA